LPPRGHLTCDNLTQRQRGRTSEISFGFPARIRSRDKARDLTGVFGFFALLRVAVRDEVPAHPEMIVVFDGELGSAARRGTDPAYKAHRPGGEAALAPIKALPDVSAALTP
jgi:DNA polymerase I